MKCPICKNEMKRSGKLHMKNNATKRMVWVDVFRCGKCGHKTIG